MHAPRAAVLRACDVHRAFTDGRTCNTRVTARGARCTRSHAPSHVARARSTLHVARDTCSDPTVPTAASYRFGPFVVDGGAYRLLRDGVNIPLSPKIIDLLLFLAARPSVLVSKDDLFRALWPDVAVTDNALTQAVSELRQALGDDPANPKYVQTVARRGYRFISPVEPIVSAAAVAASPSGIRRRRRLPTVAVLDFENVSGDASLAWLSSGIAETVTNDLRAATLRIIDRFRVTEAIAQSGRELVGAAPRARHRSRGGRQLPARRRPPAHHRAHHRRTQRRVPGGRQGRRSARPGLRPAGSHRRRSSPTHWAPAGRARRSAGVYRETSSLEAYQAFTEGRVRLESLDAAVVAGAIADFERAVVARSALRRRPRRPRQRAVLPVRDVARAQSARRGAARARDRSRAPGDRARARSGRCACHARVPARQRRPFGRGAGRRAPRRGARARLLGQPVPPGARGLGRRTSPGGGPDDGAVSGFPVRAFRGGDGAHRARDARPRRVDAARRHHRPGSSGAHEAALSGEGAALAARHRPPGTRRRRRGAAGVRSGNRAGCRGSSMDPSSR